MSDNTACVVTSIAVLVFILAALWIWRLGRLGGPSIIEKTRESWKMWREATSTTDRLYVAWVSSVFLLRGALTTFLAFLVSITSTMVVATACPRDSVQSKILWDLYERYVRPILDRILILLGMDIANEK